MRSCASELVELDASPTVTLVLPYVIRKALRVQRCHPSASSAQKSGAGAPPYSRWVNRRVGRVLAALAYVSRA